LKPLIVWVVFCLALLATAVQAAPTLTVKYTNDGFVLTANPFGPGTPSKYYFKKV